MSAQYYIWADGIEQGPMSLSHLMREWKGGNLPKGFLWRREDQESYQTPDGIEDEQKPQPPKVTQSEPKAEIPHFIPSEFSMWLAMVIFAIGFLFGLAGSAVGAALMSLAISIIMSTYAANMLRALNEIVRKLHEMDRR